MLIVYELPSGNPCLKTEAQGQIEVAISRDGSRVAFREGGVLRALERATGAVVSEPKSRTTGPLALSADGRRLASLTDSRDSRGELISVWDLDEAGRCVELPTPGAVSGLALSPDGSRLAVQARDGGTELFRIADGVRESSFPSESGKGLVFSPDGAFLAILSSEKARIVSLVTGDISEFEAVQTLAFHPDGRSLLLGREGRVDVVNERRELVRSFPVPGKGSCALGAFVGDGARMVVSGYWKRPRIIDGSSGDTVLEIPFQVGLGMAMALSADGRFLVAAGDDSWFGSAADFWAQYFGSPFPPAGGFSPYRFPGVTVHLPVLGLLTQLGWIVCGNARPLVAGWAVAGLYLGRDLAIAGHYNLLVTIVVWALAVLAWLFGGMDWLARWLTPAPSLWIAGLATAAVLGGLVLQARRSVQ